MSGGDPAAPASGPAPRASGFASNLARRVGTAALALPPILAALVLGPPMLGVVLVAAALGIGSLEIHRLLEARGVAPFKLAGLLLTAAVFLDVSSPGHSGPPLGPAGALVLLAAVVHRGEAAAVPAAAGTLLGALYLGGLGGTIAGLRLSDAAAGGWRVVLLLAIIMAADTFAFFVGRVAGRRPLAPAISPAKTIEGAIGGLAGGVAGALGARAVGLPDLPIVHGVVLGAAVAGMGMAGDLFESALKRWGGVKDSGTLFPGHGGMLDRLDSLLFGAPVLYYYFLYPR